MINEALQYLEKGYSVIPVHNKRPLVPWEAFQKRLPTEQEVNIWFKKWPKSGLGIITGQLSNLTVVDIDSKQGETEANKYLPETLETPVSQTQRGGTHIFFNYCPSMITGVQRLKDVDIRSEGGYVVVPPTTNYNWLMPINDVDPVDVPDTLVSVMKNGQPSKVSIKTGGYFAVGRRDEDLFTTANTLAKGGMPEPMIYDVMERLNVEGVDKKWADAKAKSALKRHTTRSGPIAQEVRELIDQASEIITTTYVHQQLALTSPQDKKAANMELLRLKEQKILSSMKGQGAYRIVDTNVAKMNWKGKKAKEVEIWLPFNLHTKIKLFPGNIVVIAGDKDAGKTGLLLNMIRFNMNTWDVHYFNSEMGEDEFQERLELFDGMKLDDWNFHAYERKGDFADVIKGGKNSLNIIDFLEINEDFSRIAGKIAEIHANLDGGIAIIAIQKNRGSDVGRGKDFSMEKARLYLSLSYGMVKIVSAKNFKGIVSPRGEVIRYKLAGGCNIHPTQGWEQE